MMDGSSTKIINLPQAIREALAILTVHQLQVFQAHPLLRFHQEFRHIRPVLGHLFDQLVQVVRIGRLDPWNHVK
jgi:hypothetical protein